LASNFGKVLVLPREIYELLVMNT